MKSEFRQLPSVDKLLGEQSIKRLTALYPHDLVVDVIRQRLEQERLSIARGNRCASAAEIAESVGDMVEGLVYPSLRPVVNASGVILHTNLGRAPLSKEAIWAMEEASKSYCNLELDLESGVRGSRQVHVERILCQLTGAEAALVVNNNASAVLLGLTALCKKKEVVVSRGQAVEIGGGFRIPDVMRQSGAKLVEVGTTNCTYIQDYEQAITDKTAALLRVHPSNFRVEGFTHGVALEEMIELGNRHGIQVLDDLGSGCLLDTTVFGLALEPTVQDSVKAGVGLAFFSGDKLVGGPQVGIIVGKEQLVKKLAKHPLARAVRIDKIRLAGLAATLIHYLKGEALQRVPVWRMIAMPLAEVEKRAIAWAGVLGDLAEVTDGEAMVGGGSLPGNTLPTKLVAIGTQGRGAVVAHKLAQRLRRGQPPIIGRVSGDVLFLDARSVLPEEDKIVVEALKDAVAGLK
ncbi:MAG: L-seryl-tRNA(Sec) selenium transferase [Chloroflexi bacterium]|nr:L-seryl-tRNA(Sec) selenium transferase [Chloroflexota bacterium]MBM3154415.1 L-seryl-tRNA(Sec) selenium transferase [Chloroflexota bacterium]MBM3172892.1 L-seryl-tRNA(Sec) selenium transferase [Chloroflexota bacterium]MBM3175075.1 L-seryl-tRNA(Sec) selenium transferase [Chloroflexota bacterium]MBM4449709.1 L-seryl-tRNA(Sec) selenium transferase [Chloroflexota bacterium]